LVWFEHPEHVQRDRTGEDLSRVGNEIHTMTSNRDGERVPVEWRRITRDQGRASAVPPLPYLGRIVMNYYRKMMIWRR
jgi:hypothetical protein